MPEPSGGAAVTGPATVPAAAAVGTASVAAVTAAAVFTDAARSLMWKQDAAKKETQTGSDATGIRRCTCLAPAAPPPLFLSLSFSLVRSLSWYFTPAARVYRHRPGLCSRDEREIEIDF